MLLSYLVTVHNEEESLDKLLSKLSLYKKENDEIVLIDDFSNNIKTINIINKYKEKIKFIQHKLNNNYGEHKNFGIKNCKGDWIFQLDADECPTDTLIENLHEIINSNNQNEVIWLPRLNYFSGLTEKDVLEWGWQVTNNMVNFPDYQSRLYKNLPYIKYERRLHEKVEGYKSHTFIPPQTEIAIVHEKTMEKQRQTNLNYNKLFTEAENRGYSIK